MDYHNEFDPYAADWIENLIAFGVLPPGHVDRRSIADVKPGDLKGYTQCHFFAGVGGWAHALKLAGWPNDRPVWTGSCPCQPFSNAGKRKGTADERHLWPEFARLIAERGPPVVFGEQVASKDGRVWLAGVRADLEALDYAVGAADLCAAGASAPHIRQRLYWLADTVQPGRAERRTCAGLGSFAGSSGACGLANTDSRQRDGIADGQGRLGNGASAGWQQGDGIAERGGAACGLADADVQGPARDTQRLLGAGADRRGETGRDTFWSRYDVVHCTDGKARRFEPGSFPLAHGVSNRVGRLRGYGNAIVPQVAAEFIGAYMDIA